MRKLVVACSMLMATGLLVACSSSDKKAQPLALTVTQAGDALSVSAPDTVKSGAVQITFVNRAEAPVAAEVIGVTGPQTAQEILAVLDGEEGSPIPDWLKAYGGVGSTAPGQTSTATVDLDDGTYYVLAQTSGGEDGGPEPASTKLEVSGDGGAKLPSTDATITATDYTFDAGSLKAGSNTVTFENDGQEIHHLQAFPLTPGATIDSVNEFFATEGPPTGPPPLDFEGAVGTAAVDGGKTLVTTLDLEPGKYAFVCFIQDRAGGPPHSAKGMVQEVTIG